MAKAIKEQISGTRKNKWRPSENAQTGLWESAKLAPRHSLHMQTALLLLEEGNDRAGLVLLSGNKVVT